MPEPIVYQAYALKALSMQVLLSVSVVLGLAAIAIALLCIARRRQARRGRAGAKWISLTPLGGKEAQQ